VTTSSREEHARSGDRGLVKVCVQLERADWHDHVTETLWAEPLDGNRCRLKNVPFYAYGMSYDDVVNAPKTEDGLVVQAVSEPGGHSTYRIFVSSTETLKRFPEYWAALERLGCTLERATERLFAVDVPPETDIYKVHEALAKGENAGVWDFEEAHVGHALKGPPHKASRNV
jgi:hypothetical protein